MQKCYYFKHAKPIHLPEDNIIQSCKGATIQSPGGGWIFCRGKNIFTNPARRRAENLKFYCMFKLFISQSAQNYLFHKNSSRPPPLEIEWWSPGVHHVHFKPCLLGNKRTYHCTKLKWFIYIKLCFITKEEVDKKYLTKYHSALTFILYKYSRTAHIWNCTILILCMCILAEMYRFM